MPSDPRIRIRLAATVSRATRRAFARARRLLDSMTGARGVAQAVAAEMHRQERRRAAYLRRTVAPGSPRSKRWRAGTRRTKHLARRRA